MMGKTSEHGDSGLNYIKARIDRFKIKQPMICPCCGIEGFEYCVGFCTREYKGGIEKLKMHYSSCSHCIDMEDHNQRKKSMSVWNRFVERIDKDEV